MILLILYRLHACRDYKINILIMHAWSCSYTIKLYKLYENYMSYQAVILWLAVKYHHATHITSLTIVSWTRPFPRGVAYWLEIINVLENLVNHTLFGGWHLLIGDYKCSLRESYESDSFSGWHLLISAILKKAPGLRDYSMTWHFYSMIGS